MKIYIASHWSNRPRAQAFAALIESFFPEHSVTSRWLHQEATTNPELLKLAAESDLADLDASEALVVLGSYSEADSGGMWVEMGYALGKGIPVYFIGRVSDLMIFPRLNQVTKVKNEAEFLEAIACTAPQTN